MAFSEALTQNETQTASPRIWTQIADSISYDDNRYTKWASLGVRMYSLLTPVVSVRAQIEIMTSNIDTQARKTCPSKKFSAI